MKALDFIGRLYRPHYLASFTWELSFASSIYTLIPSNGRHILELGKEAKMVARNYRGGINGKSPTVIRKRYPNGNGVSVNTTKVTYEANDAKGLVLPKGKGKVVNERRRNHVNGNHS